MCTLIGRLPNAPLDPAFSVGVSCGCSPCRWKIIMHLASVEHGASQANLNLIVLARFSAAFSSITQSDSLHRRVAHAWQTDDLRARLSINQIPLETVYNGPKTNYMTSFVDVELGSRDNRNNTNKKLQTASLQSQETLKNTYCDSSKTQRFLRRSRHRCYPTPGACARPLGLDSLATGGA